MPFRTRAVPISTTFATRPNEELACFSFEVLSHLIVNLGMDVLVGTAELRERDPRLDREEVGCGLEDIPMLKKGAERHVLRIEVLALRFLLWDEFLLERDGALEQQAQAVLVCQLRNTVKVSGKSFWVPFLRACKEILQDLAHFGRSSIEIGQIEVTQLRRMPREQLAHQHQIDGPQEADIHKLLQVFAMKARSRFG